MKISAKIKLIIKTSRTVILAILVFGSSLFLPAGSMKYWNAWLFIIIFVIPILCYYVYLFIKNPVLLEKRLNTNEKERIQNLFQFLLPLIVIAILVISGFDYRYHWSSISAVYVAIFTFIVLIGNIISLVVLKQNSYASQVVEIQESQKLIDTGLYSFVRHPMYLSASIMFCFSPLALGSFYALIPALFTPLLLAIRTINEEKVLKQGLKGYDVYMQKVRYRMIPYIW
jgi:protein-S-isoprenylcysteine O-methyltransferase Ste14